MNKHVKGSKPENKGHNYLDSARCLRKTTKCLTTMLTCTSIVLRQMVPNGARVGESFQLLFQQEWKGAPCLPRETALLPGLPHITDSLMEENGWAQSVLSPSSSILKHWAVGL